MSPTRRSFLKSTAATIAAASFTWPAVTSAIELEPVPTVISPKRPVRIAATSFDAHAVGFIVLQPDGRVSVEVPADDFSTISHVFTGDELMTPGAVLQELLNVMRIPPAS